MRKTSRKNQTGVDLTQTPNKDSNEKRNTNIKGEYHGLHKRKKIIGNHSALNCKMKGVDNSMTYLGLIKKKKMFMGSSHELVLKETYEDQD